MNEGGGDKVCMNYVVSPHGTVCVSSSKTYHYFLTFSLGALHINNLFKKKRGGDRRFIHPRQDNAKRKERRKKINLTVRAELVVGF